MKTGTETEPKESRTGPPPAKEFVASLGESGLETARWLLKNRHVLAEYAGKWVVVASQQVCFAGKDPSELLAKAERAGIPDSEIILEFVEDVARTYRTDGR